MIKIVAGLGNPGSRYKNMRHNIGFMTLDKLSERESRLAWRNAFKGEYAELVSDGRDKAYLLKPATFMNLSGESVSELCRFYKFEAEELLVVHDELDLPYGRLKFSFGGGAAGHNGIKSVSDHLGEGYYRLRMGIAGINRAEMRGFSAEYVLADFTKEERITLGDFIATGADAVITALTNDQSKAAQLINTRTKSDKEVARS